jgi:hypothetical protein
MQNMQRKLLSSVSLRMLLVEDGTKCWPQHIVRYYCDVFGRMIFARQPQFKHFHGYAGLSNRSTWLHGNQEWEISTIGMAVFLLGQPCVVKRKQDTTGVRSVVRSVVSTEEFLFWLEVSR